MSTSCWWVWPSRSCTVLYCTVLCCSVLCCTVLYCRVGDQADPVLYSTVLYCAVLCFTVLYCTLGWVTKQILFCTELYCSELYYTVLYYIVLYCTLGGGNQADSVLYRTILLCTVLYYALLCFWTVLYCRWGWPSRSCSGDSSSLTPPHRALTTPGWALELAKNFAKVHWQFWNVSVWLRSNVLYHDPESEAGPLLVPADADAGSGDSADNVRLQEERSVLRWPACSLSTCIMWYCVYSYM